VTEIKDKYGRVIHRGKNLGILRRYISRGLSGKLQYPDAYEVLRKYNFAIGVGLRRNKDRSGELHVSFADGSYCDAHFASYTVMYDCVVSRWRNLAGVDRYFYEEG